jgi:hypothetical protein
LPIPPAARFNIPLTLFSEADGPQKDFGGHMRHMRHKQHIHYVRVVMASLAALIFVLAVSILLSAWLDLPESFFYFPRRP